MMDRALQNHYERAFENWLRDNRIEYVRADEHVRHEVGDGTVKGFDFLLWPASGPKVIAEVKGRAFKGTSFARLAGLECWVTADDIDGLAKWREVLGPDYRAIFVFVYRSENIDVDFDGREALESDGNRYVFFAIELDEYCRHMRGRSPKCQTVTLRAEVVRQHLKDIHDCLSA